MTVIYQLLTVLLCISFSSLYAQKEHNNWIFGNNVGLNFNNPTAPKNISEVSLSTDEGSASVSDSNGNLLFYTDGRQVWNKNHLQMPNGFGLMGHVSSTQSALITSNPQNCNQYYIFTTDGIENNLSNGLRYSIVDISENDKLGDIVEKNILLTTPVAEKITAIKHSSENAFWLISHEWNTNTFFIYKISEIGIALHSTSNIGNIHSGGTSNINAVGYMKSSSDGSKIALINRTVKSVELFDFNNENGQITNPITFNPSYEKGYGLEFSPDNSKLYLTTANSIYQFDITLNTSNDIVNSEILIFNSSNTLRALQLASNDKIYVAVNNKPFLGAINNPNELGSNTSYVESAVSFSSGACKFGLPPLPIVSFSHDQPLNFDLGQDTSLCVGQTLVLNTNIGNASFEWQDGSMNSSYEVTIPGLYWVKTSNSCGTFADSINVEFDIPINIDLRNDTTICEGQTLIIRTEIDENLLKWQDETTASTYTIDKPGTYWAYLENSCGIYSDTVQVNYKEKNETFIPNIITPNGDRHNDYLILESFDTPKLDIYNRWGRQVYSTTKYNNDWNAENLSSGVYYYKIIDNCNQKDYRGSLTILR